MMNVPHFGPVCFIVLQLAVFSQKRHEHNLLTCLCL